LEGIHATGGEKEKHRNSAKKKAEEETSGDLEKQDRRVSSFLENGTSRKSRKKRQRKTSGRKTGLKKESFCSPRKLSCKRRN